ncbi:MAG: hypothetical protein GWP13_01145 [Planctomycetia bacterium]|nr:hypothetical protein [Planctomycetia bacterium]
MSVSRKSCHSWGRKYSGCRVTSGDQPTLFPERLDDYIAEDNPVRVVDVFIEELDPGHPGHPGFQDVDPQATGLPSPEPCH